MRPEADIRKEYDEIITNIVADGRDPSTYSTFEEYLDHSRFADGIADAMAKNLARNVEASLEERKAQEEKEKGQG